MTRSEAVLAPAFHEHYVVFTSIAITGDIECKCITDAMFKQLPSILQHYWKGIQHRTY